jgi:hypothetical protein
MYQLTEYDIHQWEWDSKHEVFTGEAKKLYSHQCGVPFPNGRKQFRILNPKTGGFRRFRWIGELEGEWWYESEDGIGARVLVDKE